MVTTIFSDEIVGASELRNKQKYWLTKALRQPVTVTDGTRRLIIANRDRIRNLFIHSQYLELAVKYFNEVLKQEKSSIFPWLEYLDEEERKQFHKEFISSIVASENWEEIEAIVEDWKATAETEHNREIMKALNTRGREGEYVELRDVKVSDKITH